MKPHGIIVTEYTLAVSHLSTGTVEVYAITPDGRVAPIVSVMANPATWTRMDTRIQTVPLLVPGETVSGKAEVVGHNLELFDEGELAATLYDFQPAKLKVGSVGTAENQKQELFEWKVQAIKPG